MNAHELARALLAGPDAPVIFEGPEGEYDPSESWAVGAPSVERSWGIVAPWRAPARTEQPPEVIVLRERALTADEIAESQRVAEVARRERLASKERAWAEAEALDEVDF